MDKNSALIRQADELKALATYSRSVDLRKPEAAGKLYQYVKDKELFKSAYAGIIQERLKSISENRSADYKCIICKTSEAENGLMCKNCMGLVLGALQDKEENSESKSETKEVTERKGDKEEAAAGETGQPVFAKRKYIAAGAAVIVTAAAIFAIIDPGDTFKRNLAGQSAIEGEMTTLFESERPQEGGEMAKTALTDSEADGSVVRDALFEDTEKSHDGFIGYDEAGNVIYMEIKGESGSENSIVGIKPGDTAHYAAQMLEESGARADMAAQQYWAEFYYNEGRIDTFVLVYNYQIPDSDGKLIYMVTIERDTVTAVSAERV